MDNTNISWTDATFNPWIGCQHVSAGCDNCYAEALDRQYGHDRWRAGKTPVLTSARNWDQPIQWNRKAELDGKRKKVFCGSMCDWNDKRVPREWRDRLFEMIRRTPFLDWQLLTKRTFDYPNEDGFGINDYPPNVWLGVTVERQDYDYRVPLLLNTNARIKWLSCEPLLGPLNLRPYLACQYRRKELFDHDSRINWVVIGGESGPNRRPMEIEWVQDLAGQCQAAGVACFVKQDSGLRPGQQGMIPEELWARKEFPCAT